MRLVLDKSLEDYLNGADETTRTLLAENGPLIQALRQTHDFFPRVLWAHSKQRGAVSQIVAMNSFMLFLAGARTALSGHQAAIFPILRTALEAACYSYLMSEDENLERVWLNRHDSPEALRACRRTFGKAVSHTAKALNEIQTGSGEIVTEAYDAAIDFGGHPNVRSVFGHVSLTEPNEDEVMVTLAGLYSADNIEVSRSLLACLDFGQAIGSVLFRGLEHQTQEVADAFDALQDAKERALGALRDT